MSTVAVDVEAQAEHASAAGGLNRMAIAVLALVGVLISLYMTAYRFGLLGEVVCGTGGCQTVQNSPWANFLGVPVPVIGLVGYGVLMLAAMAGVQPGLGRHRAVPLLLAAGATTGLIFSAYLTYLEAFVIHAWCRWCIASAGLAILIFACALPEFRRIGRSS
jgi:uncharacterized membrane protein